MKIKFLFLTIFLLILLPSSTYAFFTTSAVSTGNTLSAGTLQTKIYPSSDIVENITSFGDVEFSFELKNLGSLENENELLFSEITNESFAEKIWVEVEKNGNIYTGSLKDFQVSKFLQTAGEENTISFTFSISEENFVQTSGESVSFKIENQASQFNLPYGSGFHDKDYINVTLNNSSSILESVVYEGMCNELFGSSIGDKMIFTFSDEIPQNGHEDKIYVYFNGDSFWFPDTGKSFYEIDGNVLTITIGESDIYSRPRDIAGKYVNQIEGLIDSSGNLVYVPSNGIEIQTNVIGVGIVDVDASNVSFEDHEYGTGTLTISLTNICETPILPEHFPVIPETSTYANPASDFKHYFRANAESKTNDYFYFIGASHFPTSEGFSMAQHQSDGIYTHTITKPDGHQDTWEIGIGPWVHRHDVFVIGEVEIEIAANSSGSNTTTNTTSTSGIQKEAQNIETQLNTEISEEEIKDSDDENSEVEKKDTDEEISETENIVDEEAKPEEDVDVEEKDEDLEEDDDEYYNEKEFENNVLKSLEENEND